MKKIYLIIIFNFLLFSYSQNKSSKATYQFILKFDSIYISKLRTEMKNNFLDAEKISNEIKPELYFNNTISVFSTKFIMPLDEKKMPFIVAKTFCKCESPIYSNLKNKKLYFNYSFSGNSNKKDYLVEKKMDTNWIIHNENKKINGYLCYKATQKVLIKNEKGEFTNEVVAWFCPEIPYSFGPYGYGGLPGLIFELHDKFVSFGLETLIIDNIDTKIEIPNEGKKITYEELVGLVKEQRNSN